MKATSEFYEFADVPGTGISRVRAVLVLKDPDLIVTLDRGVGQDRAAVPDAVASAVGPEGDRVLADRPRWRSAPGDTTKTILFQVPYRQALPGGAILLKQAQTNPIQGWHYPKITTRQVRADADVRAVRHDGIDPVVHRAGPGDRFGHLHAPAGPVRRSSST